MTLLAEPATIYTGTEAWMPVRYTKALTGDENFPSLWDKYAKIVTLVWRITYGFALEEWQIWLIRHILEVYPEGHEWAGDMRFRSWCVSMARQNGKSEIASVLGLIGLLAGKHRGTYGFASTTEQTGIIYERVLNVIKANPELKQLFKKTTETRGIAGQNGNTYATKAAIASSAQGYPISVGFIDEIHIVDQALWDAVISGTGQRRNTQVGGITTAGDSDSMLLFYLYELGRQAIAMPLVQNDYGFFLWEAPEPVVPQDDDVFWDYLVKANPACASGRRDRRLVIADLRKKNDADIIRYHLNRFIVSVNTLFDMGLWYACASGEDYTYPAGASFIAFDINPERTWASIAIATRDDKGTVHTKLLGTLRHPSQDMLLQAAHACFMHYQPVSFVVDGLMLKEFGRELKYRGYPINILPLTDQTTVASILYQRLARKTLVHAGDVELADQLPRTKRKNVNDKWRISREDSSFEIDAVQATAMAVYAADIYKPPTLAVY